MIHREGVLAVPYFLFARKKNSTKEGTTLMDKKHYLSTEKYYLIIFVCPSTTVNKVIYPPSPLPPILSLGVRIGFDYGYSRRLRPFSMRDLLLFPVLLLLLLLLFFFFFFFFFLVFLIFSIET